MTNAYCSLALLALALVMGCSQPKSTAATSVPASEPPASVPPPVTDPSASKAANTTLPDAPNPELDAPRPPTPTAGQRPPADRAPRRPGEAEKITFDDLNLGMQADVVFRQFMLTDRVNELDGQRVSIAGYMHPPETSRGIKEFVLLKNTQCKFGPGGQADHLAQIILRRGVTTNFTPSPLKIEGTFKIEPFQGVDGNTWAIYRLEDAQIR